MNSSRITRHTSWSTLRQTDTHPWNVVPRALLMLPWTMAVGACVAIAASPDTSAGQASDEESVERLEAPSDRPVEKQSLDLRAVAAVIVEQTNAFRAKHDRNSVSVNRDLQEAAEAFSGYMAKHNIYGHTADNRRPSERAKTHGYDLCIVAENIAYAYRSTGFARRELANKFMQG